MRIAFFPADDSGCGYYRMRLPARALARRGHEVAIATHFNLVSAEFDIYVFQRAASKTTHDLMVELKKMGKKVIHDLDDAFDCLPEANPAKKALSLGDLKLLKDAIRIADLTTYSTPELAKRYWHLNPKQEVLENSVDLELYDLAKVNEGRGKAVATLGGSAYKLVVGWAGSATHDSDLKIIWEAVSETRRRFSEVCFVFAGGVPKDFPFWKEKWVAVVGYVPVWVYPEIIKLFDIGLCPLEKNPFNEAKSDIKALEYAASGIPCVASPSAGYKRFIRHGETGFLAETTADWVVALEALIIDEGLRRKMAKACREAAEERDIKRTVVEWERAYQGALK